MCLLISQTQEANAEELVFVNSSSQISKRRIERWSFDIGTSEIRQGLGNMRIVYQTLRHIKFRASRIPITINDENRRGC